MATQMKHSGDVDPVTFQVIKASLTGIVQEMQNALFRTGFSTIIRESQDASCAVMNAEGEVVAQHVVLPLHIGSFPVCCRAVLARYRGTLEEGDAFLINHTYEGGSPHAPDMAVITPIFAKGRHVGFCGTLAHKSDIGGAVPGSCWAGAKEVFAEGLHLPAVRYVRKGEISQEIEWILAANSRTPELVLGDIRGQLGADRLGEAPVDGSGIQLLDEAEHARPRHLVAGHDRVLDGCGAPPAREEREVQVDPTVNGHRQERLAHDPAVGDDDAELGPQRGEALLGVGEPVGRHHRDPEVPRRQRDRCRGQDPAPADRRILPGDDRGEFMGAGDRPKAGHRRGGTPGEQDAHAAIPPGADRTAPDRRTALSV
jgi:hypothetical protein